MQQTDTYAVFGHPVAHSKSPLIHARFASQCAQSLLYTAVDVEPDQFEQAVGQFFAGGGAGLNVTVPFKERAWAMAVSKSERATLAGAVNTLYLNERGELAGDNTDGIGLVRDLTSNHGATLNGAKVLVLGAGGAVRGVLPSLFAENPASIHIANRTLTRAETLASDFAACGEITPVTFEALADSTVFDFIINGTSAGLAGEMPAIPVSVVGTQTWCYDMVYGDRPTVFQGWSKAQGAARSLAGLGMLVEQAAEAFLIWRGVRPETAAVIAELGGNQSA